MRAVAVALLFTLVAPFRLAKTLAAPEFGLFFAAHGILCPACNLPVLGGVIETRL